jgi:hypothetical protein
MLTIEEMIRFPFKDLAKKDELIQTVCGCRVVESNAMELWEGGFICFDCFSENTELIHCSWCNLALMKADLVKLKYCPGCGHSFEDEDE